ncbi:sn-glycerol-3-phosphate import ATP-binding protein UgpC [Zavarzinia compransoris]|uniref:sn-glycerol-3-phosphate ABC transporter ATP-binding protein UgpC n=1 Tax=Zavarzinia compransoris TaxID=1264899 RepID=A0A317DSG6_9PROT|nr:sn-glycerol-3-phosphate import ATP-binding protein UgpC [Zavarzinia compransoris]PWR17609.1 sn-glycerol-3-phosphate ABC transporter ATP-binding protein UgpC [Zavarzinia compransoris]TDP44104.1 carbohydrate ABC transporter ATP-binding protein (CUT1 family) [Zavarzinia compransoris]
MAEISLRNLGKTYAGGIQAVADVNLAVADGEFVVLVGPSGCGKSTLLRMVAGLEEISAGEIAIGGRVVNRLEPAARDIAMVFQNYALYPHMTVRENMAYGLKNRGFPRDEIARRVEAAAHLLELQPYLDRKPRALSGGQRQRVAMGRAIVRQPAAFLFDEPLSNLDAKLRVTMRGEIRKLQRRLGTTSLYVTHDQLEAMTLADRLVVLKGGRIEQVGSPLDVYHRPASTFVAGFIGAPAMNLLAARIEAGRLILAGVEIGRADRPDGAVTLGVRAEDIGLVPPGQGVAMTLDYIEELGAGRIVHGLVDGQPLCLSLPADRALPADLAVRARARALHLFDAAGGARLAESVAEPEQVPA